MIISVDEARAYYAHPSQHVGVTPEELPDWMEYWAEEGVCIVFHPMPAPDVWMAHLGVKPEAWGNTLEPTKRILQAFWGEKQPKRIVAWIDDHRRAAIALARKAGAVVDGQFPGTIMLGWRM